MGHWDKMRISMETVYRIVVLLLLAYLCYHVYNGGA